MEGIILASFCAFSTFLQRYTAAVLLLLYTVSISFQRGCAAACLLGRAAEISRSCVYNMRGGVCVSLAFLVFSFEKFIGFKDERLPGTYTHRKRK